MGMTSTLEAVRKQLRQVPDLERLLARIHTNGSRRLHTQHPDGRAIFYELPTYAKRKIRDLRQALQGLARLGEVRRTLSKALDECGITSTLLRAAARDQFPVLEPELARFEAGFDMEHAEREGRVVPRPGLDAEYDAALAGVTAVQ